MNHATQKKREGSLYGLCIGDALAMPVHWYYNRRALDRDYGRVTDYRAPVNPHPDSILWRSAYTAPNPAGDILHDQARYWGRPGVHYHQFLKAGENTLNVKLCRLLVESLNQVGTYDADDFLTRYIAFMTTPGSHRDTYVEECHRNFFENFARGLPPRRCAVDEKHIGGLVGILPLAAWYSDRPDRARTTALDHLSLTHPGPRMTGAGALILDILLKVFAGTPLDAAIVEHLESQANPLMAHPFLKWLPDPDERVIGQRLSPACYVEDAVPAVIYLALKYHRDPETALIVNTHLGGDNAGRGAVLGALLGAAHGTAAFPDRWVHGLRDPLPALSRQPPFFRRAAAICR